MRACGQGGQGSTAESLLCAHSRRPQGRGVAGRAGPLVAEERVVELKATRLGGRSNWPPTPLPARLEAGDDCVIGAAVLLANAAKVQLGLRQAGGQRLGRRAYACVGVDLRVCDQLTSTCCHMPRPACTALMTGYP